MPGVEFRRVRTPEDDASEFNSGWRWVVVLCATVMVAAIIGLVALMVFLALFGGSA